MPTFSRQTVLAWLRQSPGAASPSNFQKVIERLRWIRDLGLDPQITSRVHQNRLQQLAREGTRMTAQHLQFNNDDRRDATLVAFLLSTAEDLVDQALEMHDKLMGQQFKKGERKQEDQEGEDEEDIPAALLGLHILHPAGRRLGTPCLLSRRRRARPRDVDTGTAATPTQERLA